MPAGQRAEERRLVHLEQGRCGSAARIDGVQSAAERQPSPPAVGDLATAAVALPDRLASRSVLLDHCSAVAALNSTQRGAVRAESGPAEVCAQAQIRRGAPRRLWAVFIVRGG